MMVACCTFLTARLEELILPDGITRPFRSLEPGENIFFDELPRDFLKDADYAVCCLPLQDRTKKSGRLISKVRALEPTPRYTITRRRYDREILFRCLMYAPAAELVGSAGGPGLADRFLASIAGYKVIADSAGNVITIETDESSRPWNAAAELDRKLLRPKLAIIRVRFTGGIDTVTEMPIIPSAQIVPLTEH